MNRPPAPTRCPACTAMSAAIICPICKAEKPMLAPVVLHPALTAAQAHDVSKRLNARIVVGEGFNLRLRPLPPEAA